MTRWGRASGGARKRRGNGVAPQWTAVLALACVAALVVSGCASQAGAKPTATGTVKAAATTSPTVGATVTPAATPIEITDLGQFRSKLQSAVYSGKWPNLVPLLSPEFSFQSPHAGSHLLMPYSIQNLRIVFEGGGSWVDGGYYTNFFSCYAGNTPGNQVLGFLGNGGNYGGAFLLFGVQKWQGYWVVSWGFDNPIGPNDGISCHIEGA